MTTVRERRKKHWHRYFQKNFSAHDVNIDPVSNHKKLLRVKIDSTFTEQLDSATVCIFREKVCAIES